ncbi:hypothetical protein [Dyella sp.]|jgi:hypothetical protein|uniref:hypothetical protein n=1 Tax=Dyella sp. TaxID=1869338 RepID=UPI002FD8F8DF
MSKNQNLVHPHRIFEEPYQAGGTGTAWPDCRNHGTLKKDLIVRTNDEDAHPIFIGLIAPLRAHRSNIEPSSAQETGQLPNTAVKEYLTAQFGARQDMYRTSEKKRLSVETVVAYFATTAGSSQNCEAAVVKMVSQYERRRKIKAKRPNQAKRRFEVANNLIELRNLETNSRKGGENAS